MEFSLKKKRYRYILIKMALIVMGAAVFALLGSAIAIYFFSEIHMIFAYGALYGALLGIIFGNLLADNLLRHRKGKLTIDVTLANPSACHKRQLYYSENISVSLDEKRSVEVPVVANLKSFPD